MQILCLDLAFFPAMSFQKARVYAFDRSREGGNFRVGASFSNSGLVPSPGLCCHGCRHALAHGCRSGCRCRGFRALGGHPGRRFPSGRRSRRNRPLRRLCRAPACCFRGLGGCSGLVLSLSSGYRLRRLRGGRRELLALGFWVLVE